MNIWNRHVFDSIPETMCRGLDAAQCPVHSYNRWRRQLFTSVKSREVEGGVEHLASHVLTFTETLATEDVLGTSLSLSENVCNAKVHCESKRYCMW